MTSYPVVRPRRCDDLHALAAAQCIANSRGNWVVVCRSDQTIRMLSSIVGNMRHISGVGDVRDHRDALPQVLFVHKALMREHQALHTVASLAVCWPVSVRTLNSYVNLIQHPGTVFASTQGND